MELRVECRINLTDWELDSLRSLAAAGNIRFAQAYIMAKCNDDGRIILMDDVITAILKQAE